MKGFSFRNRMGLGLITATLFAAAILVAVPALGNHGSTAQSTCVRSKNPAGITTTVSLSPTDPDGANCGQWICNAAVAEGGFVTPNPCVSPVMQTNITGGGSTIGVKPLAFPEGTWTLTVFVYNLDAGEVSSALTWNFPDTNAIQQKTVAGSAHWKVNAMSTSGLDAGLFEVYFGDVLANG